MRASLTKKIVASSQPKDRPYEVQDAQVRGLILRVQPSGLKSWIVTWAHGKRRTLGSADHITLDQARDSARKVIAEFIQLGLPSIAKPELPKVTLQMFLDEHYTPWAKTELKGAEDAIKRIRQAFPKLLPLPLTEIDTKVIESWWAERLDDTVRPTNSARKISKATASRNLATLRSALSKALKWKMIDHNPVALARLRTAKP